MAKKISPPLKWHGGKYYLAQWIISNFPPHVHYVEPYAGGLSVLLARSGEGISEVVNDLDGGLINFWKTLADENLFSRFIRRIEATPVSQELFEKTLTEPEPTDPVDRAVWFFIQCRQSRQGLRRDFCTLSRNRTRRGMNEQASSWLSAIEGLPDVHARIKRVVIMHDDALAVIRSQDSPNTFFYCDPPYLPGSRVTTRDYVEEMDREDHVLLLNQLKSIQGKFLLSGYPSKLYDDIADVCGWRRIEKRIDCKASGKSVKPMRTEVLWANY